jgi:hypothetical protein
MSGGAYSGVGDVELLVLAAMSAVCTSGNASKLSITDLDLKGERVLIRVDFNVP